MCIYFIYLNVLKLLWNSFVRLFIYSFIKNVAKLLWEKILFVLLYVYYLCKNVKMLLNNIYNFYFI